MKRLFGFLCITIVVAILSSCNIDKDITTTLPPSIVLDSQTGVYTVKQGREIIIAPDYESVGDEAAYRWTMDGEVLGTSPSLLFKREAVGQYFITIEVQTDGGSDSEEIRVDVVELEIPTVSIAGNKSLTVAVGTELSFKASVRETSLPTTLVWDLNGEAVSEESTYIFKAETVGSYTVSATATNEDGTHSVRCRSR